MSSANEPTVEEILESIKQVIARDNRVSAAEVRRQRESDRLPEAEAEEVREEQEVAEEGVLDLSATSEYLTDSADDEFEDEDEFGFEDEESDFGDDADTPLLKQQTEAGIRDSLAALALLSEPGAQPQIVRSGETSLEGMVRELLRPALAEWLDKNLPPLVERMVADEIRRISSRKG